MANQKDTAHPQALVSDAVANHATGQFAPHGTMSVRQEGPVVVGEAYGPFNLEFMEAYGRMWSKHFRKWGGPGAKVLVTHWHGSMLTSMEVLSAFGALMLASSKVLDSNMLHIWHVPQDLEGRPFMLPRWTVEMDRSGLRFVICSEASEVEAAVAGHLAGA